MNTSDLIGTLTRLLEELLDGPSRGEAYILNTGDAGLLRSLDKLSASAASARSNGGATIAGHVDHVRYGLSLINRWSAGEDPYADADWGAAWRTSTVSDAEWTRLRSDLRAEASRWLDALRSPRDVSETELRTLIGTIVHLAYHLGAIRQIDRAARGPSESGSSGIAGEASRTTA